MGTDGRSVNMDWWEYTLLEDGTYGLNDLESLNANGSEGTAGYLGDFTSDGRIVGTVPTYISTDNGKNFIPVTSLKYTFSGCQGELENLIIAPKIPITVTKMDMAFYKTTSLKYAPSIIPDNVEKMNYTFAECTNLETTPKLGKNIKDLTATFMNTNITKAPEIPNGVNNMQFTFHNCKSLVTPPSVIPNSVTNMLQTFFECSKLQGEITINANIDESIVYEFNGTGVKGYHQTFADAATYGNGIVIKNTSTCAHEILDIWTNSNSNVILEN